MSAINADNRDAWQAIADDLSRQRPSVGRRVKVIGGRKHKGRMGTVKRHQRDKYDDPFRYATEAQAHMREMSGRRGYVVLIQPDDDGGAAFWVKADYVEVLAS